MDEVRAFFNNPFPSSSQIIKLRGPSTGGHRITKEDNINELNRPEEHRRSVLVSGTDYAREIKEKETATYLKNETERENAESMPLGLDSLELLSSCGTNMQNIEELTEEAMTEVYSKYSFQRKEDTNNLAINEYRQEILKLISKFPVVIIEGPTGCGKTTQVPQWILDDSYKNRKPCKIVVTQPRRIAAISIAKRVAQERGWNVGGIVGYQVALESHTSSDTRIHYVTTGVLLQKLVNAKTMNEYTHVILDEVHERGQEMDFLLLVVKRLLYTVSPQVKVVLMSATFNRKAFADYFTIPTPRGLNMTASVKVVKKEPMFTVKTFYTNHLNKFGSVLQQIKPKTDTPGIVPEMHHLVVRLIDAFEQIDKKEDNYTERSEADLPSVLIFLPGINEIEDLYGFLTDTNLRLPRLVIQKNNVALQPVLIGRAWKQSLASDIDKITSFLESVKTAFITS